MEETAPGKGNVLVSIWLAGRRVLAMLMSGEYEISLIIQIDQGSKPEKPVGGSRAE
jgi:hypothetical protein